MDFNLNSEQLAFQSAARDFSLGELAPHAAKWDAEKFFPVEQIKAAGELGFCGMYAPEEWGGLGLSRLDATLILEELARGCTSTAAFISIQNMATWMLCKWGTQALCESWANDLTSGQKLASYCLTEPNAGSDAASLRTRAKLEDDHYIVNGSKMFISGAGSTDMLITMVRTGTFEEGAKGISALAIPANLEGIEYGKNEEKMGWNSQPTRAITFENVKVPAHHLLGNEGEGFKFAMAGLDGGRINIAACSLGAAQAALNLSQRKLIKRKFDQDDKRRSMLELTKTGLSVYDELVPLSYEYEKRLLNCFSKAEQQQFSELIDRLYLHAGSFESSKNEE